MIRQKLRILTLQHLARGPHSGYQLIKEIHGQTGWKPSYGSIYPLLDQLKEEKLVSCKEKGRSKLYTLTATGKKEQKEFYQHHEELKEKFAETFKLMSHMLGLEEDPDTQSIIKSFFSAMERGEMPFKGIMKPTGEMKREFWRLHEAGTLDRNKKEVVKIIKEATEKLRKLK